MQFQPTLKKIFCSILKNPKICNGVFLSDHAGGHIVSPVPKSWQENAYDMKFGTVILCNVTKRMVKKFFKIAVIWWWRH